MAKKISQLTELSTLSNDDLLAVVDNANTATKKVKASTVKSFVGVPTTTDELTEGSTNKYYHNTVDDLANYELKTNTGSTLAVSIDPTTYIMTMLLKNSAGTTLSTQTVDLPLESMVVNATYSNGTLTLTLQNGQTLDIDISDIVSGLVPDSRTIAGIDLADNITASELASGIKTTLDTFYAALSHTHAYSEITGKPETFTPSAHTHAQSEVTGLETTLAGKINEPATDGTSGQVLTTNGSGGRSWTTVQSGGGDVNSVNGKVGAVILNTDDIAEGTTNKYVTSTEKSTWNSKQNALTFDSSPTTSSTNPVTSGGVKSYVDTQVGNIDTLLTNLNSGGGVA